MNIVHYFQGKINLAPAWKERAFFALIIVLVACLSFALGRLSVLYGEGTDFKVEYPAQK